MRIFLDYKKEDWDDISSSLGMYSAEPGKGGGLRQIKKTGENLQSMSKH